MKSSRIGLFFGLVSFTLASSALAASEPVPASATTVALASAPAADGCPDAHIVLPLDHGPRAETTPYANEQRRRKAEAAAQACHAQQAALTAKSRAGSDAIRQ